MNRIIILILFCMYHTHGFSQNLGAIENKGRISCLYHNDSLLKINVYDFADRKPEFPGGDSAMKEFIKNHLKFPAKDCIEGTVFVQFVVDLNGEIIHKSIRKSLRRDLEIEAMRIVDQMPPWIPASCEGNLVPFLVTIPVVFRIK